jgi:hypothetical protein
MDFGDAIRAMKEGKKVARAGWNAKNMWIALSGENAETRTIPSDRFWSPHARAFADSHGGSAPVLPCIIMKTADEKILMGWLASQTDILSSDWSVVD